MTLRQRVRKLDVVHTVIGDQSEDKMELGNASERITIHGRFENPEEFQKKIDNAFELKAYAERKLSKSDGTRK